LTLTRYNAVRFNIGWLIALAVPVSYIIFGCLLGFDCLVRQTRKDGAWSVDAARLIFLGLPGFYFSFYLLRKPILPAWSLSQQFVAVAAVVLGYVLITSFYKR